MARQRTDENHTGSRRRSSDNPLAAARSGAAENTPVAKAKTNATDWIEIGTKNDNPRSAKNATAASTTTVSSKRDRKAEQIWHRRSGAGFRLFVEYYRGQPEGIVVSGEVPSKQGPCPSPLTVTTPRDAIATTGGGRSRAALRRKKKRRKNPTEDTATTDGHSRMQLRPQSERVVNGSPSAAMPLLVDYRRDRLLYNGRLLEAGSSRTKEAPTKNHQDGTASVEFQNFLMALSKPLPLTFRFRNQRCERRIRKIEALRRDLDDSTSSSSSSSSNTRLARANVRPVAFDPEHNIYQAMAPPRPLGRSIDVDDDDDHPFPVDKASLKRLCPELKEFLNEHTLDGTIARQELGSMLPVWLLNRVGAFSVSDQKMVRVLDTCASPGSKTLQAAELLSLRKGRVRANDVNATRLESLKEAVRRSGFFAEYSDDSGSSMESVVRFSNTDASRYPIPKSEAKKYSIILCDVPCSGDGTCRKDVHIIPNWTPSISNALHSLQVKILARALRCVAIGGIVSYSTCSLNPIEDEAVVGAVLENERRNGTPKSGFEFELMKISDTALNGLVLRPGVGSWRVAGFDPRGAASTGNEDEDDDEEPPAKLEWYETYQSAVEGGMEGVVESMWPQTAVDEKDGPSRLPPLDRCLRLLPQDQDTGGFFVALIRRTK